MTTNDEILGNYTQAMNDGDFVLVASLVHPRETFRAAIIANASSVILAHDHPPGTWIPAKKTGLFTIDFGKRARSWELTCWISSSLLTNADCRLQRRGCIFKLVARGQPAAGSSNWRIQMNEEQNREAVRLIGELANLLNFDICKTEEHQSLDVEAGHAPKPFEVGGGTKRLKFKDVRERRGRLSIVRFAPKCLVVPASWMHGQFCTKNRFMVMLLLNWTRRCLTWKTRSEGDMG